MAEIPDGAKRMNGNEHMDRPLLLRAAERGIFGSQTRLERAAITDALFVYLDGEPGPEAAAALDAAYLSRPWVCLTEAWDGFVQERYPHARVFRRTVMKPARRFRFPEATPLPEGCRLAGMDETAFRAHPFGHGTNYPSYEAFRAEGSGAVVWRSGAIAASASSFLSLDGEVEMDVSTAEDYRGMGLATACVAAMLRDCMARGLRVHWDAQNAASRRLAEKFGFEAEREYPVYWVDAEEG